MKKKIFFMSVFVLLACIFLFNKGKEEVEAANCTTYWNYYLFLDAESGACFTENGVCYVSEGYYERTTMKSFQLGFPSTAVNLNKGLVKLTTSGTSTDTTMTLSDFYTIFNASDDDTPYPNSSATKKYIRAETYANASDQVLDTTAYNLSQGLYVNGVQVAPPYDYTHFANSLSKINSDGQYGNFSVGTNVNGIVAGSDGVSFNRVSRTWVESDLTHLRAGNYVYDDDTTYAFYWSSGTYAGQYKGAKWMFSPAVYYVSYQLCEDDPTPTTTYKVTVHYMDNDTKTIKLLNDYDAYKNLADGTTRTYSCPSAFTTSGVNYVVADNSTDIKSVTIDGADEEIYCYYDVSDTNMVTVHYYIENTTTELKDDLVETDVAVGTYKTTCPTTLSKNSITYKNTSVNPTSSSVTMTATNSGVITCYYSPTYTATIKYGEDENCTNVLDTKIQTGLIKGDSITFEYPTKISNLTYSSVGNYSNAISDLQARSNKLTFTMPASDVTICLVYTPQTGVTTVRIALIVAIITLGYLAFYTFKNRKLDIIEESE